MKKCYLSSILVLALLGVGGFSLHPAKAASNTITAKEKQDERPSLLSNMFGEDKDNQAETLTVISEEDKTIIQEYVGKHYPNKCTTAKNRECAAAEKKRYVIGERLLPGISNSVPNDLVAKLKDLPKNYKYVRVGKDVLLISTKSKIIIDAVMLVPAETEANEDGSATKKVRMFKSGKKIKAETTPDNSVTTTPE